MATPPRTTTHERVTVTPSYGTYLNMSQGALTSRRVCRPRNTLAIINSVCRPRPHGVQPHRLASDVSTALWCVVHNGGTSP